MRKNIVAFDVETTGLDTTNDFVIQLAAVKINENFEIIDEFVEFVRPIPVDWKIADGAFEKHGFTKEFIMENGSGMVDVGKRFIEFIDGCDMLSYNGNNFDVKILSKDLRSAGYELTIDDRTFFDSMALETILNPRKLEAVYNRYTGKTLEGAHNAIYDVYATIEVFKHQIDKFAEQEVTLDQIMEFEESKIFCIDGMIKKDGEKILFAKGKYRDVEFMEVAKQDVGYIKWFMNNPGFDINTKKILKEYYAKNR